MAETLAAVLPLLEEQPAAPVSVGPNLQERTKEEPTDAEVNAAIDALKEKALRQAGHAWGQRGAIERSAEILKAALALPPKRGHRKEGLNAENKLAHTEQS